MRETQHILVSREASIRAQQKKERHHQQGVDMKARWVEKENLLSNPVDMAQALSKVRTSSVSIPSSLSRFHGTTLYNTTPPKPQRD